MIARFKRNHSNDRGAALVEFAFIAPLLILLVLGIIEFSWYLGNNLDVRHGAREGARLAAVDADTTGAMVTTVCDSMDFASGQIVIFEDPGVVGDEATVTVRINPYDSLTGFMDPFVPNDIETTVSIRVEQDSNWATNGPGGATCP